jgi:thymidine phosphorylase
VDAYLVEINTFELGMISVELGGGRKTKEDKIDHKAGIIFKPKLGDKIKKGYIIAELYSSSSKKIKVAKERFRNLLKFSHKEIAKPQLIKKILK